MALTKLHQGTLTDHHKRLRLDVPALRDALVHKESESIDTILRRDLKESRHQEDETLAKTVAPETDLDRVRLKIISKEAVTAVGIATDYRTSLIMDLSSIECHRLHRTLSAVDSETPILEKGAMGHRHTSTEPSTEATRLILDTRTSLS